jgi:acyl dehydratase
LVEENIQKSDIDAKKLVSFFSIVEQAAQWREYFDLLAKVYSKMYQDMMSAYLYFPKALIAENLGRMELSKGRQFSPPLRKEEAQPKTLMYFEDFHAGQVFTSGKTILSKEDIAQFANLTGDWNKLHVDSEYAESRGFEGIIAHGMLTLSIALGLWHSLDLTNGTIVAFAGLSNVSFKAPVYPGSKLSLRAEVISKRETKSKRDVGLVSLKMQLLNDETHAVVLEAEPVLLISKRDNPSP